MNCAFITDTYANRFEEQISERLAVLECNGFEILDIKFSESNSGYSALIIFTEKDNK